MVSGPGSVLMGEERALLAAAQDGDETAFARLVAPYRIELHAHAYRMLASLHDAEDALQETLLRAWRALPRFEGRSSLRSWLYRIATNVSLDTLGRRDKRVLPLDAAAAADPHDGPGLPLVESVWIEPYPDHVLGVEDGRGTPEARYEHRESVELAFIAALQHLPPNQRAALILREVLGFSAEETAGFLDTSVASINSALQRARRTVDARLPDRSQQQTLRALGDERLAELVEAYITAMDSGDVDAVIGMLAEDAAWSMPPLASWFRGLADLRVFLVTGPLSGQYRWKRVAAHANGQLAVAAYTWHEDQHAFLPFALDVLTLDGERIAEVCAFIARDAPVEDREHYRQWPDRPADAAKVAHVFTRFGLPERLS